MIPIQAIAQEANAVQSLKPQILDLFRKENETKTNVGSFQTNQNHKPTISDRVWMRNQDIIKALRRKGVKCAKRDNNRALAELVQSNQLKRFEYETDLGRQSYFTLTL